MILVPQTITFQHRGSFKRTEKFFKAMTKRIWMRNLESYGQKGVEALSSATPRNSGKTASSWRYEITQTNHAVTISWLNNNTNDGVNIAVILQYGHGTRNGGYVKGIDYINPALKPVFDEIAQSAWKEVISA